MSQYAPRKPHPRQSRKPDIASRRIVLLASPLLLLTACAQTPPAVEPEPIPTTISAPTSPSSVSPTISIRDAEGVPIPEVESQPPPPAVTAPMPAASPSPAGLKDFVCMPASEFKAQQQAKARLERKARAITRPPEDKAEAPAASVSEPPPGSKLDNVRAIEPGEVMSLLGKKVWGPTGDDMGRIVDLLVEPSGQIRSAVIDFGGFLGVGNRKIAVNWNLLKLHSGNDAKQVVLTLDRDQVLAAPEYKDPAHPAEVVAPAAKHGG